MYKVNVILHDLRVSSEQLDVSIYISFPFRHGYLGLFLF